MKTLDNKLIVYDSNCKVCSSWKDIVLKLTTIPESKVIAYKDLNADLISRVDPERFRNVMALIDTGGGKTIYGTEGVAFIFSSRYRVVDILLKRKPMFSLFNFLYKIQAYNRYIIATPKSNFKCDCFPDRVIKYRVAYIVIAMMVAIVLTAMFGISLQRFFPDISNAEAATQMLLMAGTGWILQIGLAVGILRSHALDYIGHLASIMVAGLLILVPWMLIGVVMKTPYPFLPATSVAISSGWMLYLHIHRVRYLELSQAWTASWFVLLQSTAIFWVYFFHIK